jgi:outer membrane protein TolC
MICFSLPALTTYAEEPSTKKANSPISVARTAVPDDLSSNDEIKIAPLPFLEEEEPNPAIPSPTAAPLNRPGWSAPANIVPLDLTPLPDCPLPDLASEFQNAYQQFGHQHTDISSLSTIPPLLNHPARTNGPEPSTWNLFHDDRTQAPSIPRNTSEFRMLPASSSNRIIATAPYEDLKLDEHRSDVLSPNDQPLWWKSFVSASLHPTNQTQPVDTHSLVFLALKNSPRIQAISQNPLIREMQIIESDSVFDAIGFVKTNYNDRNDPVGNTLVTGGPPFLRDNLWQGDFGVRRKMRTGANLDLNQRLGFQNSNSQFFTPQDQGTATLSLNLNQPLLRGRGKYVNESQILIAQANSGAAWDTFSNELQDELQQIAAAYWRLYYDRSLFLQKKRNVERGQQILSILEGRQDLDSLPSQIARARSAVESRRTELANAFRDIRNTETEIRRRIADRDWLSAQQIELLPSESPAEEPSQLTVEDVVKTSLEYRREIKEALHRAKAAGIQYDVSENELLPELSFLLGGYVSALNGNSGILNSWADQFGNTPGYNAGFNFEMPYGNRAAISRLSQRKLQLTKIKAEMEQTIQQVIADAQIALRRVESAIQTRGSALIAIEAARADLQQQSRRWELFGLVEGDFAEGQNPVILLNQVLDAQERLSAAELIYAQAELELKIAEVGLQRAMGTLLIYQNVDIQSGTVCGTPYVELDVLKDR